MAEFRIQRCLGRGGFGEVYRAVMSRGGGVEVDVAVKVLRADLDPTSQGVQRLRDEGRLLGRLTHPTILRVYDLVVIDGHAALVSEYVDGDDLARLLRQEEIPARAVYEAVAQVADALDAAWSWPSVTDGKPLHLVHRDIKPDNIRIEPVGTVKLLDYGIAQARAVRREAQTSVNIIMGSTQYLSPERLVQQEIGPEADVFALGCTLFEALTGEALFLRKSMRQMYLLMVEEQRFDAFAVDRTEAYRERLGGDRGIALIRAMTAWRKQNRPTAAEVAARCDMISEGTPGPTLASWCRTRTWQPPPEISGSLEGLTFLTSTSLGLDDPSTGAVASPGHRAAPLPRQQGMTDELPFSREETQRLELPPERILGATPDRALSRWLAEDPTDARGRRRAPVLGEVEHRPSTDDLQQVAAVDPHAGPWSAAEMVALYASQEAAPPRTTAPRPPAVPARSDSAPYTLPRTGEHPRLPVAPLPAEPRPASFEDEPPSIWVPNPRPPAAPDHGSDEVEALAVDAADDDEPTNTGAVEVPPDPEPEVVPREEPWTEPTAGAALSTARLPVLLRQQPPSTPAVAQAREEESTVRIQRRPKTRADGTPIPRRRLMAKPIQAPRFARTSPEGDEVPRDTTMPIPLTLDQQEAAQEPTLRMPKKRLLAADLEDTWAGTLENAPTPTGAAPRALRPFEDKGLDEVPEAARAAPSAPPPPAPPAPPPPAPKPTTPAPVQALRPAPLAETDPQSPRAEVELEMPNPPTSTADPRRRRSDSSPLLAAGASLAALLLGVGVLLVILLGALLLNS